MKILAIFGACLGAIAGALVWAKLMQHTSTEYAIVAWAIGGLVGFGAAIFKGRGPVMGSVCAILALLAIFMGKMYGFSFTISHELDQDMSYGNMIELYEELKTDAHDFALLKSEDEYPQFMIDHGYVEASRIEDVSEEDINDFKEYNIPELIAFKDNPPEYTSWSSQKSAEVKGALTGQGFVLPMVIDDLGLFDLLFVFLGIATAFKVGSGMTVET